MLFREYCFRTAVSSGKKTVSSLGTQIRGWEELTELCPGNSVRAQKLAELGV